MYKQKTTNILTKYGLPVKSDLISRGKQCRSNNDSPPFERHCLPLLIRSDLIGKPYLVSMFVAFCLYIFFLFVALLNIDR